ncbi:hypothetical protein [Enterobacter hormaechei]|uniref:hypothetical protein n=1 Tax=Enterobacter hormaechei TaxID=158836 RepID=UPI00125243BA|nr:hypothetical protein [Enterobacter hormaechei]VAG19647.1 Uncharacterised protein [Enterobacter hormaechei]VAG49036.1 Uncharacterised protein [Enterobacter hormaechei]
MAISIFLAILMALTAIFWDFVVENYVVLGTVFTAFAFFVTAWAAWAASKSADEAMKAVKLTRDSLHEMRKSSFVQWFETLIEQHEKFYEEVKSELSISGSNLKIRIDMDVLNGAYYTATVNPILIRYINHIISILNYIDKDIYILSEDIEKRKYYVEQLRNSIEPNVMLIIAIFGIRLDERRMYNQKKLNFLLNKYDFFDNELFFESAISETNRLDNYVSGLFERDYRSFVRCYIKYRVISNDIEVSGYEPEPAHSLPLRLTHSVFWSYKSPCGDILREKFNSINDNMINEIEYYISNATDKLVKASDTLCELIGYQLASSEKLKRRSRMYIVKDRAAVFSLLNHYISRVRKNKDFIKLEDVYFVDPSGFSSSKLGTSLSKAIDDYVFYTALFNVSTSPEKEKVISETLSAIDGLISAEKVKLDKLFVKS